MVDSRTMDQPIIPHGWQIQALLRQCRTAFVVNMLTKKLDGRINDG
jgi:hypothetical protein